MLLRKYWEKRKFKETPEPRGRVLAASKNRFVVQEHWASHHHFDFRLEMEGVLKSWAVPKGIPEKTGVKHLAIQTENHPVDYIDFEGEIPKGHYGAGIVKVFDKGRYKLIKKTEESILFGLEGERLNGKYNLVKLKNRENQWLLFKVK